MAEYKVVNVELDGTGDSAAVSSAGMVLTGIQTPSGLASTALTLKASDDQHGTFSPVYDSSGTEVSIVTAASRFVNLKESMLFALPFIKVTPGSSESAKTLKLVFQKVV